MDDDFNEFVIDLITNNIDTNIITQEFQSASISNNT